jgi:hypothetical protein
MYLSAEDMVTDRIVGFLRALFGGFLTSRQLRSSFSLGNLRILRKKGVLYAAAFF